MAGRQPGDGELYVEPHRRNERSECGYSALACACACYEAWAAIGRVFTAYFDTRILLFSLPQPGGLPDNTGPLSSPNHSYRLISNNSSRISPPCSTEQGAVWGLRDNTNLRSISSNS